MRAATLGSLSAAVLFLSAVNLAQAPPRDRATTEAPTGPAHIRGRVIAAESGTPLRRAQVRAVATGLRTTRLTSIDTEGRYEFQNLPAGRYTISVTKAGYVGLEFGQQRPFEGGRPLDVADAALADAIDFALPQSGDRILESNEGLTTRSALRGGVT